MPIQFPDFQRISFDEANPMLVGMERGQKFAQNAIQFPQDMQAKMLANQIAQAQAKYAEPMAKEGLTAIQQQNQFNPRIWNSEIGLRGAQSGLAGSQSKNLNVETQMNQMKLNYLQKMLSGGGMAAGGASGSASGGNMAVGGSNPAVNGGNASVGGGNMAVGGAPQAQAGGQAQQSPNNQAYYGIETPQPNQQDIVNKMLMGIDTFTPRLENAKTQQQDQYKKYQDSIGQSIQESNAATSMNQAMNVFNQAMDKSWYKGQRFGHIPSSGLFTPPGDMSPEQEADRAAMNMLPAAIETLKDAMGSARFSNLDMNMASKMKFDRTMNDDTRNLQTKWIRGVNERLQEKSKFLSYLGNPNSGAKKAEADQLWNNYQQDFPLISQDGQTYNGSNLGNWPLYTTPKAISSIQRTGSYSPSKSEKNVFMMKLPDGTIAPIKKGKVESAFKKGARPL